jgi:deoxyribodipyrimidine photo-lyase
MVADYFCQTMKKNWRIGAQYFEEKSLDHDIDINYLCWIQSAKIGPGSSYARSSVTSQSRELDPQGHFIKKWIPELQNVPVKYIHEPNEMPTDI